MLNLTGSEFSSPALTGILTHLPSSLKVLGLGGSTVSGAEIDTSPTYIRRQSTNMLYIDKTMHNFHEKYTFVSEGVTKDAFVRFIDFLGTPLDELDNFVRSPVLSGPNNHLQCMLSTGDVRQSLLHIATRHDSEDRVEWLLRNGATFEARDYKGFTPFHRAIEVGSNRSLQHFLSHFANTAHQDISTILRVLFHKNHMQETPLYSASLRGSSSVLRLTKDLLDAHPVEAETVIASMNRKDLVESSGHSRAELLDIINKVYSY